MLVALYKLMFCVGQSNKCICLGLGRKNGNEHCLYKHQNVHSGGLGLLTILLPLLSLAPCTWPGSVLSRSFYFLNPVSTWSIKKSDVDTASK